MSASGPLHVAVDANVLEASWGGIPKHVHRIATELAAGGDRVDLLVNLRRWESPVPGARAVPVRLKGRPLWRDVAVPAWARRNRPDVLWAPEGVLPRRPGVPSVVTVHDLAPLLFPGSKPPAVERAFRTSHPRSVRAADRVICVSDQTARDVAGCGGRSPGASASSPTASTTASRRATAMPPAPRSASGSGSRSPTCSTSARSSRAKASTS